MPASRWVAYPRRRMLRTAALVSLLAFPLLTSLLPATAAPTAIGPGRYYLALGDSLTTGTEAEGNYDGKPGYPNYLYDAIKGTSGLELKRLGRDGETSSSMRAGGQLDEALAFLAEQRVAGQVVSPITLDIGGNDMVAVLRGQTDINTALGMFRTNFGAILDALLGATTVDGQRTSDLVVMTYYNPYPGVKPPFYPIDTSASVARFNAVIKEEAGARGIDVAPVFEAFEGKQTQYVFARPFQIPQTEKTLDYHPTEAGHQAIAATFRQTLGYILETKVYLPVVIK